VPKDYVLRLHPVWLWLNPRCISDPPVSPAASTATKPRQKYAGCSALGELSHGVDVRGRDLVYPPRHCRPLRGARVRGEVEHEPSDTEMIQVLSVHVIRHPALRLSRRQIPTFHVRCSLVGQQSAILDDLVLDSATVPFLSVAACLFWIRSRSRCRMTGSCVFEPLSFRAKPQASLVGCEVGIQSFKQALKQRTVSTYNAYLGDPGSSPISASMFFSLF